ncbi:MAG: hypothetical protein ACR2GC_10130 [Methyloceanibacter sp.]|uniref:hypothetical protein n=1 Tax=Methyloceanibacter sp. TaxID=1965321 RepID=UPI003D9B92AE
MAKVFSTDADFVARVGTTAAQDTGHGVADSGALSTLHTVEQELAALEATPNVTKARALAASLNASSVGPFATPAVAARLQAAQLRVGKLVSG